MTPAAQAALERLTAAFSALPDMREDAPLVLYPAVLRAIRADLALVAAAVEAGAREQVEHRETLAQAIFWLLRAYQSGHREGWEPGPSRTETMDGLFTWLCHEGFDPNVKTTPQFVPGILAALEKARWITT